MTPNKGVMGSDAKQGLEIGYLGQGQWHWDRGHLELDTRITLEMKGQDLVPEREKDLPPSPPPTPIMHQPQCCLLPVGTQHCGWSSRRAVTPHVALLLIFVTLGS